jgi:VanZ family protein
MERSEHRTDTVRNRGRVGEGPGRFPPVRRGFVHRLHNRKTEPLKIIVLLAVFPRTVERMSSIRAEATTRRWWVFVLLVAAFICYFSVFASPDVGVERLGPLSLFGRDKWFHAVGYAVLAVSLAVAVSGNRRGGRYGRVLLLALVGAVGFGIAMELAQLAVPLRHTSAMDVVADTVGAAVGTAGWWLLARRDEADLRS